MGQNQPEILEIPEMDAGEKRLNELGYKQELRREMVSFLIWILCHMFPFPSYFSVFYIGLL